MRKLHMSSAMLACTRSLLAEDAGRRSKISKSKRSILMRSASKCFLFAVVAGVLLGATAGRLSAQCSCQPTPFFDPETSMTLNACMINPPSPVIGTINAAPCNIGVYFNNPGKNLQVGDKKQPQTDISGATHYGVLVDGSANNIAVDVTNTAVHDIGDPTKPNSDQGIGISYRAFQLGGMTGTAGGTVSNCNVYNYEKGGIEANGQGVNVTARNTTVTGGNGIFGTGPDTFQAQNGIQVGFGASGTVTGNTVINNVHTPDAFFAATGVLVAGGPTYNGTAQCPGSSSTNPCPYTTGTMVLKNTLNNNDVGAYLYNPLDDNLDAPTTMTNNKVINNSMSTSSCSNAYVVGASVIGNNDKVINNNMSGYIIPRDPNTGLGCFPVDPSPTPGNNGTSTKVHASPHK
jgi:hypothetical protein